MPIDAIVFDLDGVLVDSERVWDEARRDLVARHGGTWSPTATRDMMGMSSPEWSAYLHDRLGVALPPDEISDLVVAHVERVYTEHLPLIDGARTAVTALAARWPLGLASSSNRPVIERFLDASGLRDAFRISVSSEEVPRGKPAPDVYVEALRRLGADAARSVAVEDSTNGITAAATAGVYVIAIPNADFPPSDDALARAGTVLPGLAGLTVELVEALEP
jgi:HAD superfamily hydrolase (TIGR01509 family)